MRHKSLLLLSLMGMFTVGLMLASLLAAEAGGGGGGTTTPQAYQEMETLVWAEFTQTALASTPDNPPTWEALRQNAALTMTATLFTPTPTPALTNVPPNTSAASGRLGVVLLQPNPDSPDAFMGQVYLVDADGDNLQAISPVGVHANFPMWSPDGRTLYYLGTQGFMRVDVETGVSESLPIEDGIFAVNPTLSPDGDFLAYEAPGNQLVVYSLEDESITPLVEGEFNYGLSWSPDSQRLAFLSTRENAPGYGAGRVWVVNRDGSGLRLLLEGEDSYTYAYTDSIPQWTPDGESLIYTSNGVLLEVEIETGEVQSLITAGVTPYNPRISPDGESVAFLVFDAEGGMALYAYNRESGTSEAVVRPQRFIISYTWSPDSTHLAYIADDNYLYLVDKNGGLGRPVVGGVSDSYPFAWQPE